MFIGASPGSTGGGIKTTTAFTVFRSIQCFVTNRSYTAFYRKIPNESVMKAFNIVILAISMICLSTFLINIIQPEFSFVQAFFEVVSSFGTVGLSTGITPSLNGLSKSGCYAILWE